MPTPIMKLICQFLILAGASVLFTQKEAAAQEPEVLLQPVDMAVTELNEKQARILDRIKKEPASLDVKVVRLREKAMEDNDRPLLVHLPGDEKLEMKEYKMTKDKGTVKLEWKHGKDSAVLRLSSRSATGLIYKGDNVYSVEPIGNGLQAVVRVDQTKYRDHPSADDKTAKQAQR